MKPLEKEDVSVTFKPVTKDAIQHHIQAAVGSLLQEIKAEQAQRLKALETDLKASAEQTDQTMAAFRAAINIAIETSRAAGESQQEHTEDIIEPPPQQQGPPVISVSVNPLPVLMEQRAPVQSVRTESLCGDLFARFRAANQQQDPRFPKRDVPSQNKPDGKGWVFSGPGYGSGSGQ